MLRYECFVLKTVVRQKDRIEPALEKAADVAAESLRKSLYEENALLTAKTVFEYTLSAILDEEGFGPVRVTAAINGKEITDPKELENSKRGDLISICFEAGPIEVKAPGRKLYYEKILVRSLTLD
ncbi:MAG: hypothetical protein K6F63_01880 [Lachnospiraceae bacterium]|nr:hypothetical protein [Lachnospiraceae bacterium]